MKLEVGMYVRTDMGIGKVIVGEKIDFGIKGKSPIRFRTPIDKSSHNIIDLIEVGDYVNGHLVYEIEEHSDGYDKELHLESCEIGSYRIDRYDAKNKIKEVLTHELFEANCYKVGE